MTWLIVGRSSRDYIATMVTAALRLLALAALILMPFGMGAGSARAEQPAAHAMVQGGTKGHCGDQDGSSGGKVLGTHCAASCSALPQAMGVSTDFEEFVAPTFLARAVDRLAGLMPAPSTPPPRA